MLASCSVLGKMEPRLLFLFYSFFPFCVTSQFSCIFPEMVDKLILLDSSPFVLDTNVRTGLSWMLSLEETRSQGVPLVETSEAEGGGKG